MGDVEEGLVALDAVTLSAGPDILGERAERVVGDSGAGLQKGSA